MRGKKGDLPVTILTVGVLVICGLAILSFVISKSFTKDAIDLTALQEISTNVEKFNFYINVGMTSQQAANEIGASINKGQLIISKNYREISVEYKGSID